MKSERVEYMTGLAVLNPQIVERAKNGAPVSEVSRLAKERLTQADYGFLQNFDEQELVRYRAMLDRLCSKRAYESI
ncbi:MAG: hypothetical protein QMD85_01895 [Candidatus Aenigmarchaeota archaeon]|nr:hypothetical protein [Candidatus Aenigmarchaeota archaeon]MDI6722302.1 hypothetical protein [Candidatus Aenigmarchaeota archaeon]